LVRNLWLKIGFLKTRGFYGFFIFLIFQLELLASVKLAKGFGIGNPAFKLYSWRRFGVYLMGKLVGIGKKFWGVEWAYFKQLKNLGFSKGVFGGPNWPFFLGLKNFLSL